MSKEELEVFTETIILVFKKYLKKEGIVLNELEILENKFYIEFSKNFQQQSKTPTQIINEFLYELGYKNYKVTPQLLGENALFQIMHWGQLKAKNL